MSTTPAGLAPFAAALLDPARPAPPGLRTWNGSDPAARLAVYRNNVVSSLVNALAQTFPVVATLVGDEFFRAMAGVFVRQAPPRARVLAGYGAELPDFIAGFEPARSLAYLSDVARLELARVQAQHAADAAPLDSAAAQRVLSDADRLHELQLGWHPSCRLLRMDHAAVSIWAAHQTDGEPELAAIDPAAPENALVLRDGMQVLVLPLDAPAARFVAATMAGRSLGDAVDDAGPEHDLTATLMQLLRHPALSSLTLPRRTTP